MYQIYFILEWRATCFGRSLRPSSGVQDCTYSNICLLASKTGQTGCDWSFGLLVCDTVRSDWLWLVFWSSGLSYRSVRQVMTGVLVFWLVISFGQTGDDWRVGLLVCDTVRSDRWWLACWSSGLWYRSVREVMTDVLVFWLVIPFGQTCGDWRFGEKHIRAADKFLRKYGNTLYNRVYRVSDTYLRPRYAQLFLSLNRPVGTAYFSVSGLVNTKNHFEHRYQKNRR
jgi:hypothetical protein